jgi:hypothetical protein
VNNINAAGENVSRRVELFKENVLDYYDESRLADVVCAFNFSYNILKPREQLIDYFRNARKGLKQDGLFVLDIFGGTESYDEVFEPRSVGEKDFNYIWDQREFNPITHDMTCFIHFIFRDGSIMPKAFEYRWRLRTVPEIIESLYEAGFSKVRCFWEEDLDGEDKAQREAITQEEMDDDILEDLKELDFLEPDEEFVAAADDDDDDDDEEEADTHYVEVTDVENQASWISYIVAEY